MHTIQIKDRQTLEISGVNNVISFDEHGVVLDSEDGILCIEGSELNIKSLDLQGSSIYIEGKLTSLYYHDGERKQKSFLSRIFG